MPFADSQNRLIAVHKCYTYMMDDALIQIRIATVDDLLDVQSCARKAYSKYVDRIGQEPAPMVAAFKRQIELDHVYVVMCRSLFAGYVVFYPEDDHIQLENVAIIPSYAGQGIGKKLIEFVEQKARDLDHQAVELYTNEAMTENLAMYPKLGYVEIERNQQMGFSRVFFRKHV